MGNTNQRKEVLESMLEALELPASAYEKAKDRYESLGEWFNREKSDLAGNDPHIFPQGSFRLGTAIKPLNDGETYDLDLACNLRAGISAGTHTQYQLKTIVGNEIKAYREAHGIKTPVEEKHRCWRIEYQDDLSFHMDIVPCIPAEQNIRKNIFESVRAIKDSENIADEVSQRAVNITDDRRSDYKIICPNWYISNPEGYARWFISRMNQFVSTVLLDKAQVDDVPIYKRKTPLQRAVQLLKRHRDQMFRQNTDVKPISMIITTLAAKVYNGENDIESALSNILAEMGGCVSPKKPRVPNPVNPAEDFADRWYSAEGLRLNLEKNFHSWLQQAQADFKIIGSIPDPEFLSDQASKKFAVTVNKADIAARIGVAVPSVTILSTKKACHS